jgi:hypothetical protein
MTEFGKEKLLTTTTLENLGCNIALCHVTLFRLANGAVEDGPWTPATEGSWAAPPSTPASSISHSSPATDATTGPGPAHVAVALPLLGCRR